MDALNFYARVYSCILCKVGINIFYLIMIYIGILYVNLLIKFFELPVAENDVIKYIGKSAEV